MAARAFGGIGLAPGEDAVIELMDGWYNAAYILLPILLQVALLPAYKLYWSTFAGMALVILGMALMRNLKR